MFNYMPERIYAKVKDDDKYKEAVKLLEDTYVSKAVASKSIIGYENFLYRSREKDLDFANKYLAMLEETVNRLCPEYITEYKMIYEYYKSKEELIEIFNDDKYDHETRLICLSDIINLSYTDTTFDEWTNKYLDFFGMCTDDEVKSFSGYIILKAMHMKIYMHTYGFAGKEITKDMIDEAIAFNKQALADCLKFYPDKDTAYNGFVEACTDSLQNLVALTTDVDLLLYYAKMIEDENDGNEYQYQKYSFAVLLLQDKKNDLYLLSGRYTDFMHGVMNVMNYISEAYKDIDKFARGLSYYDKRNYADFLCILRKYLKLKNISPCMRRLDMFSIKNVPADDYTCAMSDITAESKTVYSENIATIVGRYRDSVDKFLSDDNKVLQDFCKIE